MNEIKMEEENFLKGTEKIIGPKGNPNLQGWCCCHRYIFRSTYYKNFNATRLQKSPIMTLKLLVHTIIFG